MRLRQIGNVGMAGSGNKKKIETYVTYNYTIYLWEKHKKVVGIDKTCHFGQATLKIPLQNS